MVTSASTLFYHAVFYLFYMSESEQIGDQNAYERTLSEHIGNIFNEWELV